MIAYKDTDGIINAAGLYLEQNPKATIIVVTDSQRSASIVLQHVKCRTNWKKSLREGRVVSRTRNAIEFADGAKLITVSSETVRRGRFRGMLADAIFIDTYPIVDRDVYEAVAPCLRWWRH